MTWVKLHRPLLLCLALLFSLAAVFTTQLLTGFGHLTGDRLDGMIQTGILEHWFNTLRGRANWDTTNYFYPYRGTLAYNDGYLLYGLAYAGWRAMGVDPFLATEAVVLVLRVLGFAAAFEFARRVLRLPFPWATLGAVLFTVNVSTYQQSAHTQILSTVFGPAAALLAARVLKSLEVGRVKAALGWGAGFAVLAGSWLLTAFYMAWLLALYTLLLMAATLALDRGMRERALSTFRREWPAVAAIALMCTAAALPFLMLYLPKAQESGMHDFAALRPFLPHVRETFRVGPGNLMWGWSDALLFRDSGASAERIVGWPPVILGCFAAAAWSWRRSPAIGPAILAILAVYVLTLSFGKVSGWWAVYHSVPGAKAIRVVARAWIMLAGPVLCVVLLWLHRLGCRRPLAAAALAALLVAEQLSSGPHVAGLDRMAELQHLRLVLPAPEQCRAFTVLSARTDDPEVVKVLQTNSANMNAMLVAEVAGLPTINGLSTFNPPDWNAADPSSPGYVARMAAYIRAHGLSGVCGLDLRTGRWYDDLLDYKPFRLIPTGGLLSMRDGEAGGDLLGNGWSTPDSWGRWGGPRSTLRFLTQGSQGQEAIRLTAWSIVFPSPPTGTQRVAVMVNGKLVTIWTVSAVPAAYQALLPTSRDALEVTFVNLDLDGGADTASVADGTTPGLGLIAIRLDWP